MSEINNALSKGFVLHGPNVTYRIEKILGAGGFGITYLAIGEVTVGNVPAEVKFAIKEHFPSSYCTRNGLTVTVKDGNLDAYKSSLSDFISEAKKLHSLGAQNENIVKVNEVFEENGTAYYVMQYINGESLASYVKSKGKLQYHEAIGILSPIFDAVDFLHKSRINHLDIKPENIMLHRGVDGIIPILIDFGLSVHFKKNGEKTSPKGVEGVSEGYSPLEQYAGIREFNPATDIYALAATLLYSITGKTPKSASEIRLSETRTVLASIVPQNVVDGLCKAMIKSCEDRTSSVNTFKAELGLISGGSSITEILDKEKEKKKKLFKVIAIGAIILIIIGVAIILFSRKPNHTSPTPQPIPVDTTQIDSITTEDIIVPTPSPEFLTALAKSSDLAKRSDDCIRAARHRGHFTEDEKATVKSFIESVNLIKSSSDISLLDSNQKDTYRMIVEKSEDAQSAVNKYKTHDELRPAPVNPTPVVTPSPQKQAAIEGTLQLGYGSWKGGIKNGKPDGKGRITFTSSHRVDRSSSAEANAGDYFIATYDNGSLISGKLYDRSGNLLQTIIP